MTAELYQLRITDTESGNVTNHSNQTLQEICKIFVDAPLESTLVITSPEVFVNHPDIEVSIYYDIIADTFYVYQNLSDVTTKILEIDAHNATFYHQDDENALEGLSIAMMIYQTYLKHSF